MASNGISTNASASTAPPRHRRFQISFSGLFLRLAIALILSMIIIMAFFVSGVVSQ